MNFFIVMAQQTLIGNNFYICLKEKSLLLVISKTLKKICDWLSNLLSNILLLMQCQCRYIIINFMSLQKPSLSYKFYINLKKVPILRQSYKRNDNVI